MFTAPNPVDQHAISAAALQGVVGVVDRGDVEHDRHVAAHLHRRRLGEDLPQPAVPEQPACRLTSRFSVMSWYRRARRGPSPPGAAARGAPRSRAADRRAPAPRRGARRGPAARRRGCSAPGRSAWPFAREGDQRVDQDLPPRAGVGQDLAARLARQPVSGRGARRGDIEDVQEPAVAADPDHLPAQRLDQIDVVGLQIAADQRQRPDTPPARARSGG